MALELELGIKLGIEYVLAKLKATAVLKFNPLNSL